MKMPETLALDTLFLVLEDYRTRCPEDGAVSKDWARNQLNRPQERRNGASPAVTLDKSTLQWRSWNSSSANGSAIIPAEGDTSILDESLHSLTAAEFRRLKEQVGDVHSGVTTVPVKGSRVKSSESRIESRAYRSQLASSLRIFTDKFWTPYDPDPASTGSLHHARTGQADRLLKGRPSTSSRPVSAVRRATPSPHKPPLRQDNTPTATTTPTIAITPTPLATHAAHANIARPALTRTATPSHTNTSPSPHTLKTTPTTPDPSAPDQTPDTPAPQGSDVQRDKSALPPPFDSLSSDALHSLCGDDTDANSQAGAFGERPVSVCSASDPLTRDDWERDTILSLDGLSVTSRPTSARLQGLTPVAHQTSTPITHHSSTPIAHHTSTAHVRARVGVSDVTTGSADVTTHSADVTTHSADVVISCENYVSESEDDDDKYPEPSVHDSRRMLSLSTLPDLGLRPEKVDALDLPVYAKGDRRKYDFDASVTDTTPAYDYSEPLSHALSELNLSEISRAEQPWTEQVSVKPRDAVEEFIVSRFMEFERLQAKTVEQERMQHERLRAVRSRHAKSRVYPTSRVQSARTWREKRCCIDCVQAACVGDCPGKAVGGGGLETGGDVGEACALCSERLCPGGGACSSSVYDARSRGAGGLQDDDRPKTPARSPHSCKSCQGRHTAKLINANNALLGRPKSGRATFASGQNSTEPPDLVRPLGATLSLDTTRASEAKELARSVSEPCSRPLTPANKALRRPGRAGLLPGKSYFSQRRVSLTDRESVFLKAKLEANKNIRSARRRRPKTAL